MDGMILLTWMACGVICYGIMKSKGYPNNKCLLHGVGGFIGGFIWLIVCLVKKPYGGTEKMLEPMGASNNNAVEQLGRLAQLRDSGAITETEFEAKKEELLKKI